MNKAQKRDLWTYLIIALLMANLFILNNYITSKAVTIIEGKNNTSINGSFNIKSLKQGVTDKYTNIVSQTKSVFGIFDSVITDSNVSASITHDTNFSTPVVINSNPQVTHITANKAKVTNKPFKASDVVDSVSDTNLSKNPIVKLKGATL